MLLPKIKAGTRKWHDLRAQGIGASESSCLFDLPDHPGYAMSQYTLRLVKRREIDPQSVFAGDPDLARMGLVLEPGIAKALAEMRGWKIKSAGYLVDDVEPLMRASMDYIIAEPTDDDCKALGYNATGPGCFQIKAVISHQFHRMWQGDVPPAYVRVQLQQELACSGFQWGAVGVLIGGLEHRVYHIRPSVRFGDDIRNRIAHFWKNCVEGDMVPPYDASESTRLALRRQYNPRTLLAGMHDREEDVALDEAAGDYDIACADRKATLARYDLALNRLNGLMGNSTNAYTQHWYIDRSISDKRRTVSVKRRYGNQSESAA